MTKGLLLVLSAPSGCGKTTILNQVLHTLPGLVFSVSHTTRAPRPGERNGIDYHFVDDATFLRMRDQQPPGFLEWAEVHGNMYGTSVEEVERQQQAGLDVVLDIDVQGAGQVRDQTAPVTIFIAPPSLEELERRLRGRGTETDDVVDMRMRTALVELSQKMEYDYRLVNDDLDEATRQLVAYVNEIAEQQ